MNGVMWRAIAFTLFGVLLLVFIVYNLCFKVEFNLRNLISDLFMCFANSSKRSRIFYVFKYSQNFKVIGENLECSTNLPFDLEYTCELETLDNATQYWSFEGNIPEGLEMPAMMVNYLSFILYENSVNFRFVSIPVLRN